MRVWTSSGGGVHLGANWAAAIAAGIIVIALTACATDGTGDVSGTDSAGSSATTAGITGGIGGNGTGGTSTGASSSGHATTGATTTTTGTPSSTGTAGAGSATTSGGGPRDDAGSGGSDGTATSGGSGSSSTGRGTTLGATTGGARDAGATATGTTGGAGTNGGATSSTTGGACTSRTGTSTRPQLTAAQAASYTIETYLAQSGTLGSLTSDPWDPTAGLGNASSFTPNFTVAADGSGTHTTVQAALNAVTGTSRRYVLVKPGTYREQVSYTGSTPVTLYGAGTDATQVTIVHNMSAAMGTSQTVNVRSNGFQFMNLTLSNDFVASAGASNVQALALLTNGDKIVLENVRMHGFQDTVQFAAPNATTRARVYVKGGYIEGDTDFIYGNATVVLDGTTIQYLSTRRGGGGVIFAPSTSVANELGFLAIRCDFTADSGTPANSVHLGRSWDASSTTPTPNGQAIVRESTIAAHISKTAPWAAAATSGRAYSATGNRFDEYCNSGPGAGP